MRGQEVPSMDIDILHQTEPGAKRHKVSAKLKSAEKQKVEIQKSENKQADEIKVGEGKFVHKQNSPPRRRKTGPNKGIATEKALPTVKKMSEPKVKPAKRSNTSGTKMVKQKGKKVVSKRANNERETQPEVDTEFHNPYSITSPKSQTKEQQKYLLYKHYAVSKNSVIKFDDVCDPKVIRTDDSETFLKHAKLVIADLKKSRKHLLINSNVPDSTERKEYRENFEHLIKNCEDTLDTILSYKTLEKSNVFVTKSDEADRIRAYKTSNSGNANAQGNVSPNVFNTPIDSTKKLTSRKSWSRCEEMILVGVVFDRQFARGSLTNACPELKGSTKSKGNPYYTWREITEQYNNSLKRFKGGNHPDRTSVALARHYKVMKHRLRKDVPDYTSVGSFRQLYREYESLNLTDKGEASRENDVDVCNEHGATRHVPASDYYSNSNRTGGRKKPSAFIEKKYITLFEKLKEQRNAFMDQLKENCQSKDKNAANCPLKISDEYTRRSKENETTQNEMETVDGHNRSQTTIRSQSPKSVAPGTAPTLGTESQKEVKQARSQCNHGYAVMQQNNQQLIHQQMQMYHQAQITQQQMQMQNLTQQQIQGMVQVPVNTAHQVNAQITPQMVYPQMAPVPIHFPMAPMPIYYIPATQTQHAQQHMQRIQIPQGNSDTVFSQPQIHR